MIAADPDMAVQESPTIPERVYYHVSHVSNVRIAEIGMHNHEKDVLKCFRS